MAQVFEKEINNSVTNVPINKLMIASNIFGKGIGLQKMNLILEKINYNDLIKTKKNKLIEILNNINGINNITSNQFINNLSKFDIFIKKNKHITINYNLENKSGKIFVFSGFRNKELEKYIQNNGGIVANNVTSKTFALIVKDKNGTSEKINKAIKLKIKIILESELKKLI
jgi:NAD-dependent DNA ligase